MSDALSKRRKLSAGIAFVAILAAGVAIVANASWSATAFRAISGLFYEMSPLANLREPSQIALFRMHVGVLIGIGGLGILLSPFVGAHGRRWIAIFALAYAIRASIWIAGGNLPLVPGDSCHYVEVASSILKGEGPVKHYVESFFKDYPQIRQNRGILDDWATPLFAYLLAGSYRMTGVVPGDSLEATFAVAKGLSFVLNVLTLPLVYVFARRRFSPEVALGSLAVLAVLPVHALYAGFELRESLVTFTSVLAVWGLSEAWASSGLARHGWCVFAGIFTGMAILSRNTAMAMAAAIGLYGLIAHGRKQFLPMIVWGFATCVVIAPWAWVTYREYGEPFHTYTKFFPYNFSWAVHHYDSGITRASDFYTRANALPIIRIKLKALVIIATFSTMILSVPIVLGFFSRIVRGNPDRPGRDVDHAVLAIAIAFVLGTLANVADVTQVAQLGRYYVPLFVLMIPTAVAGILTWLDLASSRAARPVLAFTCVALLWANPAWAHDFSWLSHPYQLHWPAMRQAGEWVRAHPREVPENARIMTWFPWEFRLASRRTTILMNRSYFAPHVARTIRNYGVTHVLWGSFEPPPEIDAEGWAKHLNVLRLQLDLGPSRVLYQSPERGAIGTFPVTLYRLAGTPQ